MPRTVEEALVARAAQGLSPQRRADLVEQLRAGNTVGGGGFLGALSRDFADLITALPAAAVLGGRVGATAGSYLSGAGVAAELGVPGTGWLRSFNRESTRQAIVAGRAVVEDFRYRYSPLAQGNFQEFGSRFMEHPLDYLLDLGAAYSLIGKGASLGARASGFGPRGRFTVPPGRGGVRGALSYIGDTSPAGRRRLRAIREVPAPAQFTTGSVKPIQVNRRAGSLNPITNALQRRLDRIADARALAIGAAQTSPQQIGGFTVPGSALARYNAAARRTGRQVRTRAADEARRDFDAVTREYQKIVRKLGPVRSRLRGRTGIEDALFLHATGLIDHKRLGFDTPREALEGVIDFWEQGILEAKGTPVVGPDGVLRYQGGQRVDKSERALEKMRRLLDQPDLLDLERAPQVLRDAVAEGRKIIREGQRRLESAEQVSRASGLITREQIEFSRVRAARQVHGGSFYSEDLLQPDLPVRVGGEVTTVSKLEQRVAALEDEARRIEQPAARADALKEARSVERSIQEAVAEYVGGNRVEGRRLVAESRARVDQLLRDSEARLPGSGRLSRGEFQVATRERALTDEDIRARLADEEARIIELRDRMAGARPDALSAGARAVPDDPAQILAGALEALPERPPPRVRRQVDPNPERRKLTRQREAIRKEQKRIEARLEGKNAPRGSARTSLEAQFARSSSKLRELDEKIDALGGPFRPDPEAEALARARAEDPAVRLEEIRKRVEKSRSEDVRARAAAELADLMRYDVPRIRALARQAAFAARDAAALGEKAQAAALNWAKTLQEALRIAVAERLALAPPGPIRDSLLRAIEDPEIGLPAPEGPLPIRRGDELRAAQAELASAERRSELLRLALEGGRPDDARGLEIRAASLEREAAVLRQPHEEFLNDRARELRAAADELAPSDAARGQRFFTGEESLDFRGDNALPSGRMRYDPSRFNSDGSRKTLSQIADDYLMELRYRAGQGDELPPGELRMLADLERADDLANVARRDREALRDIEAEGSDWLEDPARIDQAREYLREQAQGQEILAALSRLKEELAGDLADTFPEVVRMRAIRTRNALTPTGPEVRIPPDLRRRGRRQFGRMFGEGAAVPRSRSVKPDPAGLTPMQEAIENLGTGRMQEWAALERMLPADLAREHRQQIAAVYESLGTVRASFGGTPADYKDVLRDLGRARVQLRQARKRATGGWTTPRPIEAMHSMLPDTGEMAEAKLGISRLRAQEQDIIDRLIELERVGTPDDAPEVKSLLSRRAKVESRIRRAEVDLHEIETHEAIRLFGEFADPDGDYRPHRPRKGQSPKVSRETRGGTPRPLNRLSAERIYQNTGTLMRTFNLQTGRRDPLLVAHRGIRSEHSAIALENLVGRVGVRWAEDQRDDAGVIVGTADDLVRGEKTVEMMRHSPDVFRAVHLPTLSNILERFRKETPDGSFPEQSVLEAVFYKEADAQTIIGNLRRGDWNARDVVLIPKAAADEYVDAAHGIFRGYDNALGVWKAGVLVFTPRWYVLNMIGNSVQYGLLSGGDLRSILQAGLGRYIAPTKSMRKRYAEIDQKMRALVPEDVASVAQASEVGVAEGVARIGRLADRLFQFNQSLESLIRRAAYINSAKRQLRYAGERRRTRSADDLVDALDEIPDALREEAIREALRFLGDYRNFNRFERSFVRRVVPFYSWLRVISRLTLGLPFNSPLRAEALSLMATAAQAQWDPLEEVLELGRPLFARGGIDIPEEVPVIGGLTIATNQINPFMTTADLAVPVIEGLGGEDGFSLSGGLSGFMRAIAPSLTPGAGALVESVTPGYQIFGNRAVTAPAGFGGIISSFGGRQLEPRGRGYEATSGPEIPFVENVLQALVPYYGSAARQFLAGGRRAYDTTTLPSLLAYRLGLRGRGLGGVYDARRGQVFREDRPEFPRISSDAYPIGPISSLLGVRLQSIDRDAEIQARLRELEEVLRAQEQTRARIERQRAAFGGR